MKTKNRILTLILIFILIPFFLQIMITIITIPAVNEIKGVLKGDIECVDRYNPQNPYCRDNFNYIKETKDAKKPYLKAFRREYTSLSLDKGYIVITCNLGYIDKENKPHDVDRKILKYEIKREGMKWKLDKVTGYNY